MAKNLKKLWNAVEGFKSSGGPSPGKEYFVEEAVSADQFSLGKVSCDLLHVKCYNHIFPWKLSLKDFAFYCKLNYDNVFTCYFIKLTNKKKHIHK